MKGRKRCEGEGEEGKRQEIKNIPNPQVSLLCT